MSKRILACLFLAVLMLAAGVLPIAATSPDETAQLLCGGETGEWMHSLSSEYFVVTQNGWNNICLYYGTVGGETVRLTNGTLTSSNEDILFVEKYADENTYRFYPKKTGSVTVTYTDGVVSYSSEVTVNLPNCGYYTVQERTDENLVSMYTLPRNTATTLWLMSQDGFTAEETQNLSATLNGAPVLSGVTLEPVLRASGTNYDIKVTIDTENVTTGDVKVGLSEKYSSALDVWYGTNNFCGVSLRLEETPGLLYDWNGSGQWLSYLSEYTVEPSEGWQSMHLYYGTPSGGNTALTTGTFTSSNENVISVEKNSNENFYRIYMKNFGVTTLTYTDGVVSYSADVYVVLPYNGFYTAPERTEENYVKNSNYTLPRNTDVTLWILTAEGYTFEEVQGLSASLWNGGEFAVLSGVNLEAVQRPSGNYDVKVTINGDQVTTADPNFVLSETKSYILEVKSNYYLAGISLRLEEKTGLLYDGNGSGQWPGYLAEYTTTPYNGYRPMYLYYGTPSGGNTALTTGTLTSSNENVISVEKNSNENFYRIYTKNFGATTLTYTDGVVSYSEEVYVVLPENGFYTAPERTEANYVRSSPYILPRNTDVTLWILTPEGYTFEEVQGLSASLWNGGEFAVLSGVNLEAVQRPNGNYDVKVTINGDQVTTADPNFVLSETKSYALEVKSNYYLAGISLRLEETPGLLYDTNVNGTNKRAFSIYNFAPTTNGRNTLYLYYGTTSGENTALTAGTLTSSNENVISVEKGTKDNQFYFYPKAFGTATLTYTDGAVSYSQDVTVKLPGIGLYTAQERTEANYIIPPCTLPRNTDTTLWLIRENGLKATEIEGLYAALYRNNTYYTVTSGAALEPVQRPDGLYDIKITINGDQVTTTDASVKLSDSSFTTFRVYYNSGKTSYSTSFILEKQEQPAFGWNYKNGTLTVFGSGAMPDFPNQGDQPWYDVVNDIQKVVVENGVTSLGFAAFKNCPNLTSVSLPSTLGTIGTRAFEGCSALSVIELPAGVKLIGEYAFQGCTALNGVNFPASLTRIAKAAFKNCVSLTSVVVPDTVTDVGPSAFEGCTKLTSVKLSAKQPAINSSTFAGCTALTKVEVPASVTNIAADSFTNCANVTIYGYTGSAAETYALTNNIPFISTGVVEVEPVHTYKYSYVNKNVNGTSVPNYATITNYTGTGGDLVLPSAVEYNGQLYPVQRIGGGAFQNNATITSVVFPEGLIGIGSKSFLNTGLKEVSIPASVQVVDGNAFAGCMELTKAYVASRDTIIGEGAFPSSCEIIYTDGSPVKVSGDYTYIVNGSAAMILSYTGTQTEVTIPVALADENGLYYPVAEIGPGAFANQNITSVVIPSMVSEIREFAFRDCTSLVSVQFPEGLQTIGNKAFANTALTSVVLPEGLTTLGGGTFYMCSNISYVYLPSTITFMGRAHTAATQSFTDFKGADLLKTAGPAGSGCDVEFGWTTKIPAYAFYGMYSLTKVTIPATVTAMGSNAFNGCSGLKTAGPIGSGCDIEFGWTTTIPAYAFSYANTLTSIQLPSTITSIGSNAIRYCNALTEITIPGNVTSLGNYALANNENLATVTLSDGVRNLAPFAFMNCPKLTKLEIPASVTSIGNGIVQNSPNVTINGAVGSAAQSYAQANNIPFAATGEVQHKFTFNNVAFGNNDITAGVRSYSGAGGDITIPSTHTQNGQTYSVERIWDGAFRNNTTITSVTFPESVRVIEMEAFKGCTSLTEVILPPTVEYVGDGAFNGCSSLKTVHVSRSAVLGNYAFPQGCTIVYYDDGRTIENFGSYTYIHDGNVAEIMQYSGTETNVVVPSVIGGYPVTIIGAGAFRGNTMVTSVTIPASVTTIREHAFYACASLQAVTFSEGLTSIGTYAFANTGLKSVILPESLTTLHGAVFSGCQDMSYLYLPSALTTLCRQYSRSITNYPEFDNPLLTSAGPVGSGCAIEYGWKQIPNYAFDGQEYLSKLIIPADVTAGGTLWLNGCPGLKTAGPIGSGCNIEFGWTETIPGYAFYAASALYSVTLPETITKIDFNAFNTCTSLQSLSLPQNLTTIENNVFRNCTALTELVIPGGVSSIGNYAFAGCTALRSVTLPDGLKQINASLFDGDKALTSVVIPESVITIGQYAFRNCISITEVTIPNGVTSLGNYAFGNCTLLTKLEIPSTVTSVGANLTQNSPNVTIYGMSGSAAETYALSKNIPFVSIGEPSNVCGDSITWKFENGTLTLTGKDAMYSYNTGDSNTAPWAAYADQITNIVISDGIKTIGAGAFRDLTNLASIVIPDSVEKINGNAFKKCTSLKSVTFSANLKEIGGNAFDGCKALEAVVLPDSLEKIGVAAFLNCYSIKSITLGSGLVSIGNSAFMNTPADMMVVSNAELAFGTVSVDWRTAIRAKANSTAYAFAMTNGNVFIDADTGEKTYPTRGCIGGSLSWTLENGTLVLSGSGGMPNYGNIAMPWAYYSDSITNIAVVVPEGKTLSAIGNYFFRGLANLTSVALPEGLKSINEYAFADCPSLASVTLPSTLQTIKWNAFESCIALKEVVIPASVTQIQKYAFNGCTSLEKLFIYNPNAAIQANIVPRTTVIYGYANSTAYNYAVANLLTFVDLETGETVAPKTCGDNLTWAFENGTLTISGTGAMYDFNTQGSQPWYDVVNDIQKVVVENGVTSLGFAAFKNCPNLTSVVLPSGLKSIGHRAFEGCSSLQTIALPNGMTSLGNYAFASCGALTKVEIPTSVTSIGTAIMQNSPNAAIYAYTNSTAHSYAVENTIMFVSTGVYSTSWGDVPLYKDGISVDGVMDQAYANALKLQTVPYSEQYAGKASADIYALHDGKNLYVLLDVDNGYPITEYNPEYDGTKSWNTTCVELYLDWTGKGEVNADGYKYYARLDGNLIGGFAAVGKESDVTYKVTVDKTNNTYVAELCIPFHEVSAGAEIGFNCCINADANMGVDKKAKRTIASLIPNVGNSIKDWKTVTLAADDAGESSNVCGDNLTWAFENGTLTVSGTGAMYDFNTQGSQPWDAIVGEIQTVIVEEGVTSLGTSAFRMCTALTTVSLPESLTRIGNYAFAGCKNLTNINIPSAVTFFGVCAFGGCERLMSITIPASVTQEMLTKEDPDDAVFYGSSGLIICGTAGSGAQSFAAANDIPFVDVANPVPFGTYGKYLSWILQNGTLTIRGRGNPNNYAKETTPWYAYRESITKVVFDIPEGAVIEQIGAFTFYGCSNLTEIVIPEGVKSINEYVFAGCTALAAVDLPSTLEKIKWYAFNGCTALTSVELPDSLTTIYHDAFRGCSALQSIALPEGLTTIEEKTFINCTALTKVEIPASVTSIAADSFTNSPNVTIYGYTGSAAQTFAQTNNIPFVAVDVPPTTDAKVTFTLSDELVRPGGVVEVDIMADSSVAINSIALLNLTYDSSVLTFVGFTNTEEILEKCTFDNGFDAEKKIITLALSKDEALKGRICSLRFTVAEGAAEGNYSISMTSLVKLDSEEISSDVQDGKVSVINYVLGDIDGDGDVDIKDAAKLFQFSMLPERYPITYPGHVDFDKDGDVDIDDAALLFQYSMLPEIYPIN